MTKPRSSGLPVGVTLVAQTGSLLYRRLATGVVFAATCTDFVNGPARTRAMLSSALDSAVSFQVADLFDLLYVFQRHGREVTEKSQPASVRSR
jgi:hypothetical protein